MPRDIQIVLKVAERCNINCSYCYYFNAGNEEPMNRPAFVDDEVVQGVVRFLEQAATLIDLGRASVILHGGEPMMLKKERFRRLCSTLSRLKTSLPHSARIDMTTNGMLIDSEWLDIIEEFQIGTCVSIDGPAEYHDRERVDFKGRGTHARVLEGIRQLQDAASAGRFPPPGALAVIDPRSRGDVVYHHLIRELGFRCADFLVPLTIHDSRPSQEDIHQVGVFLRDAFAEWVRDDDPGISIRIFNRYMGRLLGLARDVNVAATNIVIAVGSDGSMMNDDIMQVLGADIFDRDLNVRKSSILDYLSETRTGVLAGVYEPHEECKSCNWYGVCQPPQTPWSGGQMRYSRATAFKNKLVHCSAYQDLYDDMSRYISESHVPVAEAKVEAEAGA